MRNTLYCICLVSLMACNNKSNVTENKQKQDTVIVSMKDGFRHWDGDSIFWAIPHFIEDSRSDSGGIVISSGHSAPQPVAVGIKDIKPLVLILDKDTNRYYIGGNDTIRFNRCH